MTLPSSLTELNFRDCMKFNQPLEMVALPSSVNEDSSLEAVVILNIINNILITKPAGGSGHWPGEVEPVPA